MITTGGYSTWGLVTRHWLGAQGWAVTELPGLGRGRYLHACGQYTVEGGQVGWLPRGSMLDRSITDADSLGRLRWWAGPDQYRGAGPWGRGLEGGGQPAPAEERTQVYIVLRLVTIAFDQRSQAVRGVSPDWRLLRGEIPGGARLLGRPCVPQDSVLAWDPVAESWTVAGHLQVPRDLHGVAEVPLHLLDQYCEL